MTKTTIRLYAAFALCLLCGTPRASILMAQTNERRSLTLDDLGALREVMDPQISPDGEWVAYTVRSLDFKEDKRTSSVWMSSWDGTRAVRLTFSKQSEHSPRWSPNGQYLAFLSGRGNEDEIDQLWLLNRAGGEAEKISDLKGSVTDYVWSPDGRRMVLVAEDPDPAALEPKEKSEKKTPNPIVIDRFQFKEDKVGYLGKRHQHFYLFELATRRAEMLTPGEYDEALPAWSPDGSAIAFVSKRGGDPDRHDNFDIFVIEPKAGAAARRLTSYDGSDNDPDWQSRPDWSPDGRWIAYLQGGSKELLVYAVRQLAVISSSGGPPRVLAPSLDRNVSKTRWSSDGASLFFLVEDDRNNHLARVTISTGTVEQVLAGRRDVTGFDLGAGGRLVVLSSTPQTPFEIYAVTGDQSRAITRQNEEWLAHLKLGEVEEMSFKSKDGTGVNGFLVKPPNYEAGKKYPAVLRIHGGPVSQFGNRFLFEWQLFAAHGYAVVAVNPRGSSGRGEAYSKAIFADWGNKDSQDVLAAVDFVVEKGVADPGRLGIGGWSYGGMLTNYTIARDARFKAAVSGASISNILAGYGTDQYIRDYERELGTPWANLETWLKISFPFYHADRIVTPTLFLCGEKDFNVPLLNSEQMYQALRSLGRDTQLVIYPGQFHEITKPSYIRDRLERYLAWYDKYLHERTR